MNLLLLNYEFPPLGAGAGNATKALATEFARTGHRVTVVTCWYPGLQNIEKIDGYIVIRVHSRRKRLDRSNVLEMFHFVWCAVKEGARIIRQEPPDHIISFFALPTGIVAWYFKKKFDIPYTLSLRGGDVPGFLPKDLWLHHFLSRPFEWFVWGNATHIIANSEDLRTLAQKTADNYKKTVQYIPNGVDTDTYHPATYAVREVGSPFKLLFVGRLVRQKGVTHLIRTLATIQKTAPNVWKNIRLTIVGDGPLRANLEQEATELGVSEHIEWKGWMARKVLTEEYRTHDVLVFPSFEEGMPNVVLEAMASGLAIVATNIGGTDTLVTNGQEGVLVDSYDELAPTLILLTETPDRLRQFQVMARKKAEKMGWGTVAFEYSTLLG
jgi:glycosyltransferase involved in cell wall biosynthesis